MDTNIVSFFMKEHSSANAYRAIVENHVLNLSFMTIAELYEGGYRAHWSDARWDRLELTLSQYVVLESTPELCRTWAWIRSERQARPIAPDDAWIAATALSYDCSLVTHNPADFTGIRGLKILTVVK